MLAQRLKKELKKERNTIIKSNLIVLNNNIDKIYSFIKDNTDHENGIEDKFLFTFINKSYINNTYFLKDSIYEFMRKNGFYKWTGSYSCKDYWRPKWLPFRYLWSFIW